MDRRKFLQLAGVGTASPFFNLDALAQGQTDRVLIVTDTAGAEMITQRIRTNLMEAVA